MKRLLAVCLACCLLLTGMPWNAMVVAAEDSIAVVEPEMPVPECLTYTISGGEVTITKCDSAEMGRVSIPNTIEGYPVTAIGERAFAYCYDITAVNLPSGLKTIGATAFNGCVALEAITIPDSVTTIGRHAFSNCKAAKSITIGNGVTTIGESAFENCNDASTITIGNSVETIEGWAFGNCYALESIVLPASLKSIGSWAFCYCTALASVTVPDSVTTIGDSAFSWCDALESITFGSGVTSMGKYHGTGCPKLKTITFADGITEIGSWSFGSADSVTALNLPASVTSIAQGAFSNCTLITDVYFGGTRQQWDAITIGENNPALATATIHCAAARIPLSDAALSLEYTSAYYKGQALTPSVIMTYQGETVDVAKELEITYQNNTGVGTATVTVTGVGRFEGTATLQFAISYETVPESIVNVIAVGEIGKISLSWGKSAEVLTDTYHIYRKADGETDYALIKTITNRDTLTYEDIAVEKGKAYSYYVTGVGEYGAESAPSLTAEATVAVDATAPTVLKLTPAAAAVFSGTVTLSATATDNVGVTRIAYFYSVDNGETWESIGEATNAGFSIALDTTALTAQAIKVKAVAFDAEGNESAPYTAAYVIDNVGPEQVTGLSAIALSSKITLSWDDVEATDAACFVLQAQVEGIWADVAQSITTLGYTVTGLQAATGYTYRVACVDVHGNVGEYSGPITVQTAADETAPVITAQGPSPARYNNAIPFRVTAKDDCAVKEISIEVSVDLQEWTTVSTVSFENYAHQQAYAYTIDLVGFAQGSLFVRALATDWSGNVSDSGDNAPYIEYIVDKTAPTAPENVSAKGGDGYITVFWTQGGEIDLGTYAVYRATAADGSYTCIASNLASVSYHDRDVQADRVYYYKVAVSDTCGNVSADSGVVSATMASDTIAPVITGFSATYRQTVSPTMHTVKVSATDNNQLSAVILEYRTAPEADWVLLTEQTAINDHYVSLAVELPIGGLAHGETVYLRAYATDEAGLRSEDALTAYTLDNTPPSVNEPAVTQEDTVITLSWKDGGEEDLAGFKVYRSENGATFALLGTRGVSGTGIYIFTDTVSEKESGVYTYRIEAIDKLGNTGSWSTTRDYTYVYVNQKPTAQLRVPYYMTVGVEEALDASASTDDIAVMGYAWDFGDGTTSTEMRPNKTYAAAGTYTVTLTVTDTEGATATATQTVFVRERETLGVLQVKVTDDSGKPLAHMPVYFDLGSATQTVVQTDASGVAALKMSSGTHTVGMYASGYLPVKKDVTVLANATRSVTLTTVEEALVTGEFQVKRMTFDEIVAAGIDVYDPANQNVYSATVRVTYTGSKNQLNVNYIRNDSQILEYTITDDRGKPVQEYVNDNGEVRKIAGLTYVSGVGSGSSGGGNSSDGTDIVAIIDIPASASYLKEFFDVRLHIINNASSDFVLEHNEVSLHVPQGMTLMTSVGAPYETAATVTVDAIQGQQTVTLAWVLRGDKTGEYDLSADFTGTLAEFNQLINARFETKEPIKVYGLDGVKFRILAADEIHNDTLYFNVELENQRDVDIYMPSIGITEKVHNVTESVLNSNPDKDFFAQAFILNAYLQTGDGEKQHIAVTYDANGKATTAIKALAPGQMLVYEYVAYNAADYNGVASFENAVITEFEGLIENIEVGSFHKELYSFKDYTKKLDAILKGTIPEVQAAYAHLFDSMRYYYVGEADALWNSVCEDVYKSIDAVLDFDIDNFTQDEQRAMIESKILSILSDSSVVAAVDDLMVLQYCQSMVDIIEDLESELVADYGDGEETAAEIASFVGELVKDSKELSVLYANEGYDALIKALNQRLAGYAIGAAVDVASMLAPSTEYFSLSDAFDFGADIISDLYAARSQTERDAAYFAVLKLQCNAEISNYILESLIQATEKEANERLQELITTGLLSQTSPILMIAQFQLDEKELLHVVAKQMQDNLHKTMDDYRKNWEQVKNTVIQVGGTLIGTGVELVLEKMLGATPFGLITAGYTIIDSLFGCENYYKQIDSMQVDNELSKALILAFQNSSQTRDINTDFYSMLFLRALCKSRLSGEALFKSFMDDYINGVYLYKRDEAAVMERINSVKGTEYDTLSRWYDDVQYAIVSARDVLFNREITVNPEPPAAPAVTLDYERLTTLQSFSAEYEYAFADGQWQVCTGEPIAFTVGSVPSTLQVRKAATETTVAGHITTVTIFARKELSKLITVKFTDTAYVFTCLSEDRSYQLIFTDTESAPVDWSAATTVSGAQAAVDCATEFTYVWIRACEAPGKNETTSHPLLLTVGKKHPLTLSAVGNGTVAQSAPDGRYFIGDTAELTATPAAKQEFLGWYIDGVCVSTDTTYLAEMSAGLAVTAHFTDRHFAQLTTQPASVVVAKGKAAKVSFTATGDGLTYQWYFKNKGASKFSLTTSFKGNAYSVVMDATRSGRQVYCVITDQYGNSVQTNTVTLGMKVSIAKQPVNSIVVNGATAKVTFTATGEGLTYKWYFKNKGDSKFSLTTTFTGNTYSAQMNSTRAGRQVYCVITDKYGNKVQTNTVTLGMKVSIAKQPVNSIVVNGATAKVTFTATGEELTYKWYFKNKGDSKFSLTTSFTGNTYSAQMNSARAGRQLYCVITDKYGNSVKTNTVTIKMQ